MSCIRPLTICNMWYHPLYANHNYYTHESNETITIPCGHCVGCLIAKQQSLEFLATRELLTLYRRKETASFITLTYSDEYLPHTKDGHQTLLKEDVQKFHKRLRINLHRAGITKKYKYIICGEYGDGSHAIDNEQTTHRSHYHLAIFGLSERELKPFIMKSWQHKGIIDIGPLTQGGLRYIISYMNKQQTTPDVKEIYEKNHIQAPFLTHSIGIGKQWLIENMDSIIESHGTFNLNGKINLYPKYILDFITNHYSIDTRKWIYEFYDKNRTKNQTIKQYLDIEAEKNFVKLQYKIAALRSKNKPVSQADLQKTYIRPVHSRLYSTRLEQYNKKQIQSLVKEALL